MARFGLKEKAERLDAEVALLESPRMVEVAALAARRWPMALACSAWLMGWDPGAQVAPPRITAARRPGSRVCVRPAGSGRPLGSGLG
jgi:hypothetical protein